LLSAPTLFPWGVLLKSTVFLKFRKPVFGLSLRKGRGWAEDGLRICS
jgi:hypothetical protein